MSRAALNIKQLIEDKSGDRDYFAMVPAMLWPDIKLCSGGSEADTAAAHAQELGVSLSVHDRWLYVTLKKICGEKDGQCFMSSRGLAKFAGMSAGQLSKSKTQLERAGLITIIAKKRTAKGWAIDHITVIDIWSRNISLIKARQRSAHLVSTLEGKCSSDEQKCSPGEQIEPKCSPHEQKCSPGETEEEPIEEEPIEEEPKEEEESLKKTIDPLLFDLERQTLENNEGNYADPTQAGGDNSAAEAGLVALYEAKDSEAPRRHSGGYIDQVEKIAQVLQDCAVTDPTVARLASQLLVEDKPSMANPYYRPFPAEYADYLGRAKKQLASQGNVTAPPRHQPENALLSQEALREHQAAQPPSPQDDAVGRSIKAQLEVHVTRPTFVQYIKPSRFACEDGALMITAPDVNKRDWLENRLGMLIERMLAGVADGPGKVVFEMIPQGVVK